MDSQVKPNKLISFLLFTFYFFPISRGLLFLLIAASYFLGSAARAQIVPDSTLGTESSVVTPNITINGINSDRIEGGAIRGANLFHSFSEFNIRDRGAAYFNNPSGIENILSRVTGGNPSNILGTLGVLGNANLFLINPNGILFGPNAQLDLGGSFIGSTANSILFENGVEFSATQPEISPLLTVNIPIGLQFRSDPGRISVRGEGLNAPDVEDVGIELAFQQNFLETKVGLRVATNKTLALVGGEIDLSGGILAAPSGRIELGSIADTGSVSLTPTQRGFTLGYEGISTYGDIQLTDRSGVFTHGLGGGDIQIQGRRISLDSSRMEVNTLGPHSGGKITVNATESVELGGTLDGQISRLGSRTFGTGNAGEVAIATGQLTVTDGADIVAETLGTGNAGTLTIEASESIEVSGTSSNGEFTSGIGAGTEGTGNGGDLTISTGRLRIRNGGEVDVSTEGEGRAGTLIVRASKLVEVSGTQGDNSSVLAAETEGAGDAGNLLIETTQLIVRDGARVGAEAIDAGDFDFISGEDAGLIGLGSGDAGTVTVRASELVRVSGVSLDGENASALGAETGGDGNAGNVTVETRQLIVENGAKVGAQTSGEGDAGTVTIRASELVEVRGTSPYENGDSSTLGTVTQGAGDAGDMTISTKHLIVRDGGLVIVSTEGSGRAGTLNISASESVELRYGVLGAVTESTGDAGSIIIDTTRLVVRDSVGVVGVGINAEGQAGTLIVRASESVELNNGVLGAATEGAGDAGNIAIETERLTLDNQSQILASGSGSGNPGSIEILASDVRLSNGSVLAAESATSQGGNITVRARDIQLRDRSEISAVNTQTSNVTAEGNININAQTIVLLEASNIITSAFNPTGGSNINIAPIEGSSLAILQSRDSTIDAVGELQLEGEIEIKRVEVNPLEFLTVEQQIFTGCDAYRGSSFVITGRGGLPPNPNQQSDSNNVSVSWVEPVESTSLGEGEIFPTTNSSQLSKQIGPARGWIFQEDGSVLLVDYNPTETLSARRLPNLPSCSNNIE